MNLERFNRVCADSQGFEPTTTKIIIRGLIDGSESFIAKYPQVAYI